MLHLVHYPWFIKLLGPLKPFWCMHFEAKHSYFKSLQRNIKIYQPSIYPINEKSTVAVSINSKLRWIRFLNFQFSHRHTKSNCSLVLIVLVEFVQHWISIVLTFVYVNRSGYVWWKTKKTWSILTIKGKNSKKITYHFWPQKKLKNQFTVHALEKY